MFRRLLRQAPFFGYVFTVISPQTVGAQGHTPSTWAKTGIIQPPRYHRLNGKYVGAYRIRPSWRRNGTFSDVGWFVTFRACSLP